MTPPIFTSWQPRHSQLWDHVPLRLEHRLHEHELFSRPALARLIESVPETNYMLVETGGLGEKKLWQEGRIGNMPGSEVIDAIAKGRMWLNLLRVNEFDERYRKLLDQIFAEIEEHIPGYRTFKRINGILISSPRAQVYYHFDTSGQTLWQIHGRKRVFLYPAAPPFLTPESLEAVTLYNNETGIKYEEWYEDFATHQDLGPGQMMQWPLNMPHRIANEDELSVSMTIEYQTAEIRRKMLVNGANGILRDKLKLTPTRNLSGAGFWSKTAMYAGVAKSGLLKRERSKRRPVTFRLDAAPLSGAQAAGESVRSPDLAPAAE